MPLSSFILLYLELEGLVETVFSRSNHTGMVSWETWWHGNDIFPNIEGASLVSIDPRKMVDGTPSAHFFQNSESPGWRKPRTSDLICKMSYDSCLIAMIAMNERAKTKKQTPNFFWTSHPVLGSAHWCFSHHFVNVVERSGWHLSEGLLMAVVIHVSFQETMSGVWDLNPMDFSLIKC